jgi:5'-nucleotidase
MKTLAGKLIIAISSRTLFDLAESNQVFEKEGYFAYEKYQAERENEVLAKGVAFSLVEKLLRLNQYGPYVEIVLLSRNSADTGLRIFNSIKHYRLDITRAAFTAGQSPHRYAKAFGSHLFLSTNPDDVKLALKEGSAAATILPTKSNGGGHRELRIAFDGDAVLFSDESERIYQENGFEVFAQNEEQLASKPLAAGPMSEFLNALHHLQEQFLPEECPIRTALVTARSAPTHERVVKTFRFWNIRIDEVLFLGGIDKGEFLKAFQADIFFDDQHGNCLSVSRHVTTGHVPHGCKNEADK